MNIEYLKKIAAEAALEYIRDNINIGIGTGTTVNYFIDALPSIKHRIKNIVCSSINSTKKLQKLGFSLVEMNDIDTIDIYVDGADEINNKLQMIKGKSGAAITGEKILASIAKKFICIADKSKKVDILGKLPIPIEIIPIARNCIIKKIINLGGMPVYRKDTLTDYGNQIIDIWNLNIIDPKKLEQIMNNIPGIVTNGLFAHNTADILLLGTDNGVQKYMI